MGETANLSGTAVGQGEAEKLLELENVSVSYGAVRALKNISLFINEGEIAALLGSNGAGKSTMLDAISRLIPLESGKIFYGGKDITKTKPAEVVRQGLSHCPEGRRIFSDMTVLENLELGAYTVRSPEQIMENMEKVFSYFPVLSARQNQKGGTLSGGEQQMLAVGRALMSSPRLLMLDEPSLGLAPKLIDQIFDIIRLINRNEKVTIFLIEQNANEALLHSDRAYVLENGGISITAGSDPRKLLEHPEIIRAYLGGK